MAYLDYFNLRFKYTIYFYHFIMARSGNCYFIFVEFELLTSREKYYKDDVNIKQKRNVLFSIKNVTLKVFLVSTFLQLNPWTHITKLIET